MRLVAVLAAALAASPAAGQIMPGQMYDAGREAEAANQQLMARQRDVALDNQLMSAEARLRADQSVRQSEMARGGPRLPEAGPLDAQPYLPSASIPDDRLAASRDRVRDAAGRRR